MTCLHSDSVEKVGQQQWWKVREGFVLYVNILHFLMTCIGQIRDECKVQKRFPVYNRGIALRNFIIILNYFPMNF